MVSRLYGLMGVALGGFLISGLVHLASWWGGPPLAEARQAVLYGGLVAVWVPAILLIGQRFLRVRSWREAVPLSAVPEWLRTLFYILSAYVAAWLLARGLIPRAGPGPLGVVAVAYYTAFLLLYAALRPAAED